MTRRDPEVTRVLTEHLPYGSVLPPVVTDSIYVDAVVVGAYG